MSALLVVVGAAWALAALWNLGCLARLRYLDDPVLVVGAVLLGPGITLALTAEAMDAPR